ncbi:MAG: regulatory protein GemA [Lachnospiraceae bacterium]|nr:regulatory protein GemA [Butyrivibrio sp.]MCM1344004.1 regulatory protein GemA [Muribaculaceae bacterium]MCM1411529.1 regulatory protein GemA [Lachnospiraceae bacterium]
MMAGKGKTAITASQMRKIHVLARDQGLDNDLLHVHIQTLTGRDSLKKLSLGEAARVIDSLEHGLSDRMTWKQGCLMNQLLEELGWTDAQGKPDHKRLDGFCSKRFGVDSHRWLTRGDASKVIEGLKNMIREKEDKDGYGGNVIRREKGNRCI